MFPQIRIKNTCIKDSRMALAATYLILIALLASAAPTHAGVQLARCGDSLRDWRLIPTTDFAETTFLGDSYMFWNLIGPAIGQDPKAYVQCRTGELYGYRAFPGARWNEAFWSGGSSIIELIAPIIANVLSLIDPLWKSGYSIKGQFEAAINSEKTVKRIIMSAGGNDLLARPEGVECAPEELEALGTSVLTLSPAEMPLPPKSCRDYIDNLLSVFDDLLIEAAKTELEEIIYVAYPRVPARLDFIPALAYGLTEVNKRISPAADLGITIKIIDLAVLFNDAEGQPRPELYECYTGEGLEFVENEDCNGIGNINFIWQALNPAIHPTAEGSRVIGKAIYEAIK